MKKKLSVLLIFLLSAVFGAFMAADIDFSAWKILDFDVITFILMTLLPFVIVWAIVDSIMDRRAFARDVSSFKRYRFFLVDLVSRDIKTKYRRSVLGVLWSVLNPLLMMCVLTAVFSQVLRVGVDDLGYYGGYPLFYLTGYVMFNFISEATNFSLVSILHSSGLIKKVYIPKYIFPLEKCCYAFVNMCLSFIAFIIVFLFFLIKGDIPISTSLFTMLLAIVPMIYIFVFAFGLGLLVSAAAVFFRDVLHLWSVFLSLWMYASPIIYPLETLPAWLVNLLRINPLTYYIDYFRCVLIRGQLPTLEQNLMCILFALAALAIGLIAFRKRQDKFILYI